MHRRRSAAQPLQPRDFALHSDRVQVMSGCMQRDGAHIDAINGTPAAIPPEEHPPLSELPERGMP
jgi:hypothetical protein